MTNRILLWFFLCTPISGLTQDYYGEIFNKWVKNDLNNTSREFAEAHYNVLWENYFVLKQEEAFEVLNRVNTTLEESAVHLKDVSKHLNSQDALDILIIDRINQYKVFGQILETKFYFDMYKIKLRETDSVSSKRHFVANNHYHSVSSSLLESFKRLQPHTMNILNPSIKVYYSTNGGYGADADFNVIGKNDKTQEVLNAGATSMTTLYLSEGGYAWAGWVGATLAVASVYLEYDDYKEAKKQLTLLKAGLNLFPQNVIKPDTAYALYLSTFSRTQKNFEIINKEIKKKIEEADSLIDYYKHLSLTQALLLDEAIQRNIRSRDDVLLELQSINVKNESLQALRILDKAMVFQKDTESSLIKSEVAKFQGRLEEYYTLLKTNLSAIQSYSKTYQYTELDTIINSWAKSIQKRITLIDNLYSFKSIGRDRIQKFQEQLNKFSFPNVYGYVGNRNNHLVYASSKSASYGNSIAIGDSDPLQFFAVTISFGDEKETLLGFKLSTSSQYRDFFYNESGFGSPLSSPYDGGYNSDVRNFSGKVSAMISNINYRADRLNKIHVQMNDSLLNVLDKNNELLTNTVTSRLRAIKDTGIEINSTLDRIKSTIAPSSDLPVNPLDSVNWNQDIQKLKEMMDSSISLEKRADQEALNVEKLLKKITGKEKNKLKIIQSHINNSKRLINCKNTKEYPYASYLVDEARTLRFSLSGNQFKVAPENNSTSYLEDMKKREDAVFLNHMTVFLACGGETPNDLKFSDCNRFAANWAYYAHGVKDFISEKGEDSGPSNTRYLTTTQISKFVYESPDWIALGEVDNQDALIQAQHKANQGYLVIAVKEGHICIVRSGRLQYSSTWGREVPSAINYGQTIKPGKRGNEITSAGKVNILIDTKLSECWKNVDKDGVQLFYRKK